MYFAHTFSYFPTNNQQRTLKMCVWVFAADSNPQEEAPLSISPTSDGSVKFVTTIFENYQTLKSASRREFDTWIVFGVNTALRWAWQSFSEQLIHYFLLYFAFFG